MTQEQMQRALSLISSAERLRSQFDKYVLLKRDSGNRGETIQVGDPVMYRKGEYHRIDVPIPEEARRLVFNLWRKEVALKYNETVRELNQLGASHGFELIRFSQMTGEPIVGGQS